MATWCNRHNRDMIPSKFGGEWCPDCARERKEKKESSQGFQKAVSGNESIMGALRQIYIKLDELEKEIKQIKTDLRISK
uniref:Uncharacterized protein n=1 Tax=viral metagenome TaxID=1070528 RepID=A0A6M3KX70_9ZZZZ